jgi:hypothetical protein
VGLFALRPSSAAIWSVMKGGWQGVIQRFEEAEGKHRALMLKAGAQPRTTWCLRRSYVAHRAFTHSAYMANLRDGVPMEGLARLGWHRQRWAIEIAVAQMRDVADREILHNRNRSVFHGAAVPSVQWLMDQAKAKGFDETGQYENVLRWVLRPDLYFYEWIESGGAKFKCLKTWKKGDPRPLESPISFLGTEDAESPLRAEVNGQVWTVRVNDFPEAPMYTLAVDGTEVMDFDNWPKKWSRPRPAVNPDGEDL